MAIERTVTGYRWKLKEEVYIILYNSMSLFVPLHFKLCFAKPTCSSYKETASLLHLAERSFAAQRNYN